MLNTSWEARAVCAALLLPTVAAAHPQSTDLEEVIVTGRQQVLAGEARSASEGVIGQVDLDIRPLLRPGDILEAVPGLIVTQHSGSGKSNQMFLRGFNLDHGTDFATWVNGMPVNQRTHGHGQGYTDINFLIPETVERMAYVKGPYHAELGDFSSAGGVRVDTFRRLPTNTLKLGLGENNYRRLLAMGSLELESGYVSGALEGQTYDGPWQDIKEDVEKVNGLLSFGSGNETRAWSADLMYYSNEWNAADQIPERAVTRGLIDEFGSIDTSLGGDTHRASLSARYSHQHHNHRSEWSAYIIDSKLNLWSNFTYLLENPTAGDQFRQVDDRTVYGGNYTRFWVTGPLEHFHHTLGVEFRYDDIDTVGLYHTQARKLISTVREDGVEEASAALFYELAWQASEQWRAVLGIRADYYAFDVEAGNRANAGSDSDALVSPKASVIYAFSATTEAYLSAGYGFHSNDARGVTITVDPATAEPTQPVDPLVKSVGAELGMKTVAFDSLNTSLALWYLELDSELLFVGDAGATEASRGSERWGLEFNNHWALNDIWSVEADFAWTHARFSGNQPEGNHIPGALESVVSGAISAKYPGGWFGSLRVRHFGNAPLVEDNTVEAEDSTIANLSLGWADAAWRVQIDFLNLLDSNDRDIEYFYASRLEGEALGGVEDVHYHAFEPRQARLHISRMF